jgi:RNA polymerase sigma factor for flagellar operon FliA
MGARIDSDRTAVAVGPRRGADKRTATATALILEHGTLVQSIAWSVLARIGYRIDFDDLVQIGRVALVEAADTFVARGDAKFTGYAAVRVRGAMIDELRHTATVSRGAIRHRRAFDQARDHLTASLARRPNDAEMAQQVGMSEASFQLAEAATHGIAFAPIDDAYSDHDAHFADVSTPDAHQLLESAGANVDLSAAMATLSERHRLVLQRSFVEERSLSEIGQELDLTGARICQLKQEALSCLRTRLLGWSIH